MSGLIAAGALVGMVAQREGGSFWSQLAVLFVMAPAALFGGYLRAR